MSIQEIAERDGISYAAAKQRVYRARRKGNAGNAFGNGNAQVTTDGNALLIAEAQIERLRLENASLRADLFAAHQELRELRQVELPMVRGPVIVPFDDI